MIELARVIAFLELHKAETKVHFARGGIVARAPLEAFRNGSFKSWQEEQNNENFERKYILSLIYVDKSRWLFGGIYQSHGAQKTETKYYYQTELLDVGNEYIGQEVWFYKYFRNSYVNLENFIHRIYLLGEGENPKMNQKLTLGTTTIEDLLLNRKISKVNTDVAVEDIDLAIPPYQRPYKWTAKNANQLLDDIVDAMNSNKEIYRVGTLILHEDQGVYNIVDGQQRTITFCLLLKALSDSVDIPFLEQKLSGKVCNIHNVLNNYKALARRIEQIKDDRIREELFKYVKEHCQLIVVITNDLSEAFQFFDSQNARGKALYPHDLLKAYHLREMRDLDSVATEKIVKVWEDLDQKKLAMLFNDYLYRIKEWMKGDRSYVLNEHNIDMFKGVTSEDNYPYAQYYKGAFAYADDLNQSKVPFVTGVQYLSPFQLNAPIIAGKPFFEYAKHYFDILADIQNNDKYEGYFINDNNIVKTLDLAKYKNGVGNGITRLMFDTAILLYVDRFCQARPSKLDIEYLEQFVDFAFIWAYSMRAQYRNVGWLVAQNYILGTSNNKKLHNSFNIYKDISEADSPKTLINRLSERIVPLNWREISADKKEDIGKKDDSEVYQNYLDHFINKKYMEH